MTVSIDALLATMSVREKLAQLGAVRYSQLTTNGELDEHKIESRCSEGIGFITRVAVESGHDARGVAAAIEAVQSFLVERTRHGIPAIVVEEGLGGFCARGATQFPQAIGLASTWDPALVEDVAVAVRLQMLAVGARLALAPVLDIACDPRWGRVEETFGEDPELVSRMGVAYVRGLQAGGGLDRGVAATGKHFLAHGASEGGVNCGEVSLGPRRLRDVHAAPFRAAIHEAALANVMTAYHAFDGEPCTASVSLLQDLLRTELAFAGVIVSDFWAVNHLCERHRVARDDARAALAAFTAGVDVELPSLDCYEHLRETIEPTAFDEAVRRVLDQKCALGLLHRAPRRSPSVVLDSLADRRRACRAAEASLVLLTNDGTLPLEASVLNRIALLGPTADDETVLLGDYSFVHQRADYTGAEPHNVRTVPIVTLRDALRDRIAPATQLEYVAGAPLVGDVSRDDLERARAAAARSDVAIVCVGGRSGTSRDATSGELRDTTDLRLPRGQRALLAAVAATGTPTIAVVISGRAYAFGDELDEVAATLLAWLPGEEGGTALVRALFGECAPAGRLPVTLLRDSGSVGGHSGRFAFGHGLTYTTFSYEDLVITAGSTDDDIVVSITVANTGTRPADEVVQVYARPECCSVGRPEPQLCAFARAAVAAGHARRMRFSIPAARLGCTGPDGRHVVEPGEVSFFVGASSVDIRAMETIHLRPGTQPEPNAMRSFASSTTEADVAAAAIAQ